MSIERKAVAFIAAASMLVGLGACSSARGGAQSTQSLEKGATIGISMPTKSAELGIKMAVTSRINSKKQDTKSFFRMLMINQHNRMRTLKIWSTTMPKLLWLAQKMELLLVLQ